MIRCVVTALLLSTMPAAASEHRALNRATDGRRLYRQECAPCHGRSGEGDGPDASSVAPPPTNVRSTLRAGHDTAALVARVLDGRRLALTIDRAALQRRADDVEAVVAHLERLSRVDWSVADRGEELWIDRCESCHGRFGGARGSFGKSIRHERAGLPAIPPLASASDEKALLAFVGLLGPGFEIYERYCAACHGGDGRGAGGDVKASGLEPPAVVFDRPYFTTHDGEYVRTKAWHMLSEHQPRMPHFRGRLTEPQARAIVDYLRSLP